jgi:hypothetical protein
MHPAGDLFHSVLIFVVDSAAPVCAWAPVIALQPMMLSYQSAALILRFIALFILE